MVASSTPDPNPNSNTATSLVPVQGSTELRLTKTSPCWAVPCQYLVYRLVAVNWGSIPAEGVVVQDHLPPSLSAGVYSLDGGITWRPWQGLLSFGTLAPGATATLLVAGVVHPCAQGTITNTAVISSQTAGQSTAAVTTPVWPPQGYRPSGMEPLLTPFIPGRRLGSPGKSPFASFPDLWYTQRIRSNRATSFSQGGFHETTGRYIFPDASLLGTPNPTGTDGPAGGQRSLHPAQGDHHPPADQDCKGILLLLSGQLRAFLLSEEGREVTLYRVREGETCVLSSSCLMDAIVFDVLIEAIEETHVITLPVTALSPLAQQRPEIELFLYKTASERFSDIMWTMQQILFMGMDRRAAIFLWDESAQKGPVLRITHDEMARYIGSAREVVTRC